MLGTLLLRPSTNRAREDKELMMERKDLVSHLHTNPFQKKHVERIGKILALSKHLQQDISIYLHMLFSPTAASAPGEPSEGNVGDVKPGQAQ